LSVVCQAVDFIKKLIKQLNYFDVTALGVQNFSDQVQENILKFGVE